MWLHRATYQQSVEEWTKKTTIFVVYAKLGRGGDWTDFKFFAQELSIESVISGSSFSLCSSFEFFLFFRASSLSDTAEKKGVEEKLLNF